MKIKISLLILYCILSSVAIQISAQTLHIIPSVPADQTALPSPEPAQIVKYAEHPVSLSTGVPDISIPLYTFPGVNLSIPVSISYHASGIKVKDHAGVVGLGWNLHAGGSITRVIKGLPDEYKTFRGPTNGIYNVDLDFLKKVQSYEIDTDYDRYYYNVCGHSGSFRYLGDGFIHRLSKDDNEIEIIEEKSKNDFSFRIITPDGTKYYFTEKEKISYSSTPSTVYAGMKLLNYSAINTWHLSKIESFDGKEKITFTYEDVPEYSISDAVRLASVSGKYTIPPAGAKTFEGSTSTSLSVNNRSNFNSKVIKTISSKKGNMKFHYKNDRSGTPNCRLEKIEVVSYYNTLIRNIEFANTGNFNYDRTRLDGLTIYNGSNKVENYTFKYHTPTRQSGKGYDLFGYANGSDVLTSSVYDTKALVSSGRKYNFSRAVENTLYRITNSTGGVTEFVYQPNSCSQTFNGSPIEIGIRVKSISVTDKISNKTKIRTFTYENPKSSINFSNLKQDHFISQSGTTSVTTSTVVTQTNLFTASCRIPGMAIENAKIYYGKVTEEITAKDELTGELENDAIKIIYEFDTSKVEHKYIKAGFDHLPATRFLGNGIPNLISATTPALTAEQRNAFSAKSVGGFFQESFWGDPPLENKKIYTKRSGKYEITEEQTNYYDPSFERISNIGLYQESMIYKKNDYLGYVSDPYESKRDINYFIISMSTGYNLLDSTVITRHYPDSVSQTERIKYKYNINTAIKSTDDFPYNCKDSNNKTLLASKKIECGSSVYEYKYYYSCNVDNNDVFTAMQDSGYMAAPVMEQLIINKKDVISLLTDYGSKSGMIKPVSKTLIHNGVIQDKREFQAYDVLGNLAQTSLNGLSPTSYFWGYIYSYPMIAAQGATYADVMNAASRSGMNYLHNDFNSIECMRISLPGALTNTYIDDPLSGCVFQADPSGRQNYFIYDGDRLSSVKDGYANIISDFQYHITDGTTSGSYNSVTARNYLFRTKQQNRFDALESTQFYDELGRPYQTVLKGITPDKQHLVSTTEYDGFGREKKIWLPSQTSTFSSKPIINYKSIATSFYNNDQSPFSENKYEDTANNRIESVTNPGDDFKLNPVTYQYKLNSEIKKELQCIRFELTGDYTFKKNGYWKNSELVVAMLSDQDGKKVYTFTDPTGKTVLTRQIDDENYVDTYMIYDNLGRIKVVLPPEVIDKITGQTWDFAKTTADNVPLHQYAYFYKYNKEGKCVEKRLPGTEPIYYIYDKAGQLIFTQDGQLRKDGKWYFTIPDYFGREALTGLYKKNNPANEISGKIIRCEYSLSTDVAGLHNTGYTLPDGFTSADIQLHTINYYDRYHFLNRYPNHKSELNQDTYFYDYGNYVYNRKVTVAQLKEASAKGFLTGTYTYSEVNNAPLVSAMYYDDRGNMVRCNSSNHFGGYNNDIYAYNFSQKMARHTHIHMRTGKKTQNIVYNYGYDHANRLKSVSVSIDGQTPIKITSNEYDGLGRIKTKKFHDETLNTTTYKYNIQGWLTDVQSDKFNQELYYNTGKGTPCYNGNISSMKWKAGNETTTRGYKFIYDDLNRLINSCYGEGTSINNNINLFTEDFTYDKNGNIQTIKRNAKLNATTPKLIDNLIFTYDGNKIMGTNVLKLVTSATDGKTLKLTSGGLNLVSGSTLEYDYDKNGNMTKDSNKNITNIEYNTLNLPKKVTFTNSRSITYSYTATGTKQRVIRKGAGIDETIDYSGNVIYKNNEVDRIIIPEGYVTFSGTTPVFHYYMKDHLSNNRVVLKQDGTVEQVNHYYSFGSTFDPAGENVQPYKYGGKELDRTYGLDLFDFEARYMDPVSGRFTTMDPLAEKYYSISPYAYCANNPIRFIDPKGTDTYEYNIDTREITWINNNGGTKQQHVDFITKEGNFFGYSMVNGANVFVYALKNNTFAITNFDAKLNDLTYNKNSGYEYSFADFTMRNELIKSENPIGKYILQTERQGVAEPITRRDAENAYGSSLMGLITLSRAMDLALSLTDGTPNIKGSPKPFNGPKSFKSKVNTIDENIINNDVSPSVTNANIPVFNVGSKNSWNSFLKANKGKYTGKGWEGRAASDYKNSEYYNK